MSCYLSIVSRDDTNATAFRVRAITAAGASALFLLSSSYERQRYVFSHCRRRFLFEGEFGLFDNNLVNF